MIELIEAKILSNFYSTFAEYVCHFTDLNCDFCGSNSYDMYLLTYSNYCLLLLESRLTQNRGDWWNFFESMPDHHDSDVFDLLLSCDLS